MSRSTPYKYDPKSGLITKKQAFPKSARKSGDASRFFNMGSHDSFISWDVPDVSADAAIYPNFLTMVGRARDLARNNDYVKHFLRLLTTNVVGWRGFKLQAKMRKARSGDIDRNFNRTLEHAWCDSQKLRNTPEVSGKLTGREISALWIRTLAINGEVIVIAKPGHKGNGYRFSLQFIDPMRLDFMRNETLPNGRRVKMGVEMDDDDRPTGYYFLTEHPNDMLFPRKAGARDWVRIDAKYVSHSYIMETPGQTRGITWLASPAIRAHMYEKFEEAVVVGARVAASKMGFYRPDENYAGEAPGDEDGYANLKQEVEPGMFELLPRGLEVTPFDPNYPPANLEEFAKTILRGLASGLGVDYVSMSNNLEGVNYSSIRHGLIEQRGMWKCLQEFQIEHFEDWRFRFWAQMQELVPDSTIPQAKLNAVMSGGLYKFTSRGWTWVDPLKEVKAYQEAVASGFTSRGRIIAETTGDDFEEVADELAEEQALMDELGVKLINAPMETAQFDAANDDGN